MPRGLLGHLRWAEYLDNICELQHPQYKNELHFIYKLEFLSSLRALFMKPKVILEQQQQQQNNKTLQYFFKPFSLQQKVFQQDYNHQETLLPWNPW